MTASILLLLLAAFLVWVRWVLTVRLHGERIGLQDAGVIYWLFQLSTYMPGGVWQYVGITYLSHRRDISKKFAAIGTHHHQIIGVTGATLTFLGFGGTAFLGHGHLPIVLLLALLVLIAAWPPLLETATSLLLRLLGRSPISFDHRYRDVLPLVSLATLTWSMTGGGFYLLAAAIEPVTFTPLFIAVLPGAWVVGFVLLLAPGGLGVREAVLIALLGDLVASPLPIILSLASQLWMLLPELVYGGIFLALDRTKHASS